MSPKVKGYILGAVAAATYGLNPLFALPLYSDGMDVDSVLFFRYLSALPILWLMIKLRGRSLAMTRKEVVPMISMGVLMAVSSLFLFMSYNYMDAGIASTILFVYPVMVAVIMAVFFRERLSVVTYACISMAVVGIVLLYNGKPGATLSAMGVFIVILASLSYSLYIVGVNKTILKDVPTLKTTFYILLFGIVVFAVRLLFAGEIALPTKWYLWGNILSLAIFPTAISFLCTTKAIQYIGSTPTAILGALEPLTALFFGIMVFGERLSVKDGFGIVLIIAAVTMVIAGGSISHYFLSLRKLFPRLRNPWKRRNRK